LRGDWETFGKMGTLNPGLTKGVEMPPGETYEQNCGSRALRPFWGVIGRKIKKARNEKRETSGILRSLPAQIHLGRKKKEEFSYMHNGRCCHTREKKENPDTGIGKEKRGRRGQHLLHHRKT